MNHIVEKKSTEDKEYRKNLYENNKDLYRKVRSDFMKGVSSNFRQRRNNGKNEFEQLEEESREVYEEVESDEYSDKN